MEKIRLGVTACALVGLVAVAGLLVDGGGPVGTGHRVMTLAAAGPSAPVPAPAPSPAPVPGGARVVEAAATVAAVPATAAPVPPATAAPATVAAAPVTAAGPAAVGGRLHPAAVADPTAGLGPLPAGWAATAHDVTVSGLNRTYLTVAPTTSTGRMPVVVLMHGVGMTAAGVLTLTGLAAQTGPAVIVAPEGWEESWDAGGCCGPAGRAGINDVGFIRTALQQVLGSYPGADPSRVYAVGFSNGGRMAYRLACDMPGTFAGFAAAEAVPVENCSALHPLSVLIIAQEDDPVLAVGAGDPPRYINGMVEPTVAAVVARERAMDGCAGAPTVTYAGVAERSVWHCAAGTRFTYVWYPGGAHSWRAPIGATPGSTDMVLSLMGGQLVSDRSVPGPPAPDRPAPGPTSTTSSTTSTSVPAPGATTTSTTATTSTPAPEPTSTSTSVTTVPPGA